MRDLTNCFHSPTRVWINQPSKFQEHHELYGKRGIAIPGTEVKGCVDVYFTEGSMFSMRIHKSCLSVCQS